MPRRTQIKRIIESEERVYTFTYLDDTPERQEAVQFFQQSRCFGGLLPAINIPPLVASMSMEAAQEYLDAHPIREQWSSLTVHYRDDHVSDDDFIRLQNLPEIEALIVRSNRVTDFGVRHFCLLTRLNRLVLYSNNVTDACLDHIVRIQTLVSLDMQSSRRVSQSAFSMALKRLPSIRNSYPPRQ